MKKHLTLLLLLFILTVNHSLYSQTINIGLKGGINYSNMLEKSDLATFSDLYEYVRGYNIGIFVESSMAQGLNGESGVFLNTKGYKFSTGNDINGVNGTFKTLWIDIPFKAKTSKTIGPITFYASGGVSGGLGLSGTLDMEWTVLGVKSNSNRDIVWGDDPEEADLIRIDYGALVGAGIEIKSVILEANYYHGLANLSPYTDEEYIINSRYFAISLGYKFGFK